MNIELNSNSIKKYKKGEIIFKENDFADKIALIITGTALIFNKGIKIVVKSGTFIGINDLFDGKYITSYMALEKSNIYIFNIDNPSTLSHILSINKDYNGLMVTSCNYGIYEINKTYQGILSYGFKIKNFIIKTYNDYIEKCKNSGYNINSIENINNLPDIEDELSFEIDKLEYYEESRNLPLDVIKAFYSHSSILTLHQIRNQVELLNQLLEQSNILYNVVVYLVNIMSGNLDSSLFTSISALASDIKKTGGYHTEIVALLNEIIEETKEVSKFFDNRIGAKLPVDLTRLEEIYNLLLKDSEDEIDSDIYLKYSIDDSKVALDEMDNSLDKILEFGNIEDEIKDKTKSLILSFINLKDKSSIDDNVRRLKKGITEVYYPIYKSVFLKAIEEKAVPRIIDMFLIYGFMDERLFTEEERLDIYFLDDNTISKPCKVYNIKEWLIEIYKGNKEPSKNDFDLDYTEMLLEEKRYGRISDDDIKRLEKDRMKKLDYEINNMFRYNNRIVTGHPSSFVPILYSDLFFGDIKRSFITAQKLNDVIDELLQIDYSIFARETLYVDTNMGIHKEVQIKEVYPDIILMPTYGTSPIMWQDITRRKRDSSGRFIFPSFSNEDLYKIMIKIFGRFRWEICRTEQGVYWNDFTYKSLTSEYADYIQFYRRNNELTEDNKTKLRSQILKGRNNLKEIFVIDYESWIQNEARGAIKLNKFAREILATYIPFSLEIRQRISQQPLFEVAMARYNRDKVKKIREIEGRYRLLERDGVKIPEELINTLEFIKETLE